MKPSDTFSVYWEEPIPEQYCQDEKECYVSWTYIFNKAKKVAISDYHHGTRKDANSAQICAAHAGEHWKSMEKQCVNVEVLFSREVIFSAQNEVDHDRNKRSQYPKDIDSIDKIGIGHIHRLVLETANQRENEPVRKPDDDRADSQQHQLLYVCFPIQEEIRKKHHDRWNMEQRSCKDHNRILP